MTKQEQKSKAYKEYLSIRERAYKEYEATYEPTKKEYLAIKDKAYKEYEAIQETAFEEYGTKCGAIDEQDIKIIDGKRYRLID